MIRTAHRKWNGGAANSISVQQPQIAEMIGHIIHRVRLIRFTSTRSAAISFVASAGFDVVGGVCGCAAVCDRRTAKLAVTMRHTVASETFLK
jgi:hypothetical protein